jgi:hypothetical protein
MTVQPIDPYEDERVTHEFAVLNGRKYRRLLFFITNNHTIITSGDRLCSGNSQAAAAARYSSLCMSQNPTIPASPEANYSPRSTASPISGVRDPRHCWGQGTYTGETDSWRHVIPGLLEMGLRVIAPDMIGYGQTVRPYLRGAAAADGVLGCSHGPAWRGTHRLWLESVRRRHGGASHAALHPASDPSGA